MYLLIHAEIYPWFPVVTDFIAGLGGFRDSGSLKPSRRSPNLNTCKGILSVNMPNILHCYVYCCYGYYYGYEKENLPVKCKSISVLSISTIVLV